METINKKILFFAFLAVLSISFYYAIQTISFSKLAYSDKDYEVLLNNHLDITTMVYLGALLFFLIPWISYLILVYILKEDENKVIFYSLIVLFTPALIKGVYSLTPLFNFNFSFDNILLLGGVLAFPLLSLLFYKKDKIYAFLSLFGLIIAPFNSVISLLFISIGGFSAVKHIKQEFYVLLFLFSFFITYSLGIQAAIALGVFFVILFYLGSSILGEKINKAVFLTMFIFLFFNSIYTINSAPKLLSSEIEAYSFVRYHNITVGVFDYPHAFEYYTGLKPILLNKSFFNENPNINVLFSTRVLDNLLNDSPNYFVLYGVSNDKAYFANSRFTLIAKYNGDNLAIAPAMEYDTKTQSSYTIPFIYLKGTKENIFDNDYRLIVTKNIPPGLYSLLFNKSKLFYKNGTWVVD